MDVLKVVQQLRDLAADPQNRATIVRVSMAEKGVHETNKIFVSQHRVRVPNTPWHQLCDWCMECIVVVCPSILYVSMKIFTAKRDLASPAHKHAMFKRKQNQQKLKMSLEPRPISLLTCTAYKPIVPPVHVSSNRTCK